MPSSVPAINEGASWVKSQVRNMLAVRAIDVENSLPKEYTVRWSLFALMWVSALWTIVIGMVAREAGRWDWKFVS